MVLVLKLQPSCVTREYRHDYVCTYDFFCIINIDNIKDIPVQIRGYDIIYERTKIKEVGLASKILCR